MENTWQLELVSARVTKRLYFPSKCSVILQSCSRTKAETRGSWFFSLIQIWSFQISCLTDWSTHSVLESVWSPCSLQSCSNYLWQRFHKMWGVFTRYFIHIDMMSCICCRFVHCTFIMQISSSNNAQLNWDQRYSGLLSTFEKEVLNQLRFMAQ